jgi:16S rRNA processing protein RimM
MVKEEDVFPIGRISKPHGVAGWLSMYVTDDVFDRVDAPYLFCRLDGLLVPFFLDDYRFKTDNSALLKFEGIDTQQQAQTLCGAEVCFPNCLSDAQRPEGGYTWESLVGYTVRDESAGLLGTITAVDTQTLNTLFTVKNSAGTEMLIPAQDDLVQDIDTVRREILMSLPDGLLHLDALEE